MQKSSRNGVHGFTLIELMIGLVILSILAALAYPAALGTVQRANRADALEALTTAANRLELFYSDNDSYTIDVDNAGPDTATAVEVRDNLPVGTSFLAAGAGSHRPARTYSS